MQKYLLPPTTVLAILKSCSKQVSLESPNVYRGSGAEERVKCFFLEVEEYLLNHRDSDGHIDYQLSDLKIEDILEQRVCSGLSKDEASVLISHIIRESLRHLDMPPQTQRLIETFISDDVLDKSMTSDDPKITRDMASDHAMFSNLSDEDMLPSPIDHSISFDRFKDLLLNPGFCFELKNIFLQLLDIPISVFQKNEGLDTIKGASFLFAGSFSHVLKDESTTLEQQTKRSKMFVNMLWKFYISKDRLQILEELNKDLAEQTAPYLPKELKEVKKPALVKLEKEKEKEKGKGKEKKEEANFEKAACAILPDIIDRIDFANINFVNLNGTQLAKNIILFEFTSFAMDYAIDSSSKFPFKRVLDDFILKWSSPDVLNKNSPDSFKDKILFSSLVSIFHSVAANVTTQKLFTEYLRKQVSTTSDSTSDSNKELKRFISKLDKDYMTLVLNILQVGTLLPQENQAAVNAKRISMILHAGMSDDKVNAKLRIGILECVLEDFFKSILQKDTIFKDFEEECKVLRAQSVTRSTFSFSPPNFITPPGRSMGGGRAMAGGSPFSPLFKREGRKRNFSEELGGSSHHVSRSTSSLPPGALTLPKFMSSGDIESFNDSIFASPDESCFMGFEGEPPVEMTPDVNTELLKLDLSKLNKDDLPSELPQDGSIFTRDETKRAKGKGPR